MTLGLAARLPAVLRELPQFRLLFAGQALSALGDGITFVALPFAVLSTGVGATEVGLVAAATTLPFFAFSLVAGVLADRLDRRSMMLTSDVVRLVCQLVAGLLLVTGVAEWWHLGIIGLFYGSADAFFQPAIYGLMPEIVPPVQLQEANALRGLVERMGIVLGPAAAGVLVVGLGPGGALLVDSATFMASIACLLALRRSTVVQVAEAIEPDPDFLTGLREGWHEVRSRSWVLSMLVGLAVYHVAVLPSIFALGPVLADAEYDGAASWAIITAAFGIGAVAGQLLLLRWRPRRAIRASALCLLIASMQAAILGSGLPVPAIAVLEGVAGIFVTAYFTLWETSIQEHVPAKAVSRVASYDLFVSVGLLPFGTAIFAPLSEVLGLQETLVLMSAIGVTAAVCVLSVPSVRTLARP
ncbi:MAG: MFS transporter [Solirubrobacteraceae bacterium]